MRPVVPPRRREQLRGAVALGEENVHRAAELRQPLAHLFGQRRFGRGGGGLAQAGGQLAQIDRTAQKPFPRRRIGELGGVAAAQCGRA
ncbi:hypothetical protein GKE62_18305 [Novosphingobium sp. Gsoil 351]|nr:hypothetical protein GKE62_18305 [Novosphingobium sp. Gsoil 351]